MSWSIQLGKSAAPIRPLISTEWFKFHRAGLQLGNPSHRLQSRDGQTVGRRLQVVASQENRAGHHPFTDAGLINVNLPAPLAIAPLVMVRSVPIEDFFGPQPSRWSARINSS